MKNGACMTMFRRFFAALTLLTAIPVPGFVSNESDIEKSKPFFPLVGLIAGCIVFCAAWLMLYFPTTVAAVGIVVFMTLISKGFHLDGLADTADGFMSSRPRERILEIMRDSHIGTMGVLAIVAVMGLKISALVSIPDEAIPFAAGFAALSGRCAIVLYINISKYARESGLGQLMFKRKSLTSCVIALAVWLYAGFYIFGLNGLIGTLLIALFPFAWAFYTKMKIGGATGDTIGACEELTEMLSLLMVSLLLHCGF